MERMYRRHPRGSEGFGSVKDATVEDEGMNTYSEDDDEEEDKDDKDDKDEVEEATKSSQRRRRLFHCGVRDKEGAADGDCVGGGSEYNECDGNVDAGLDVDDEGGEGMKSCARGGGEDCRCVGDKDVVDKDSGGRHGNGGGGVMGGGALQRPSLSSLSMSMPTSISNERNGSQGRRRRRRRRQGLRRRQQQQQERQSWVPDWVDAYHPLRSDWDRHLPFSVGEWIDERVRSTTTTTTTGTATKKDDSAGVDDATKEIEDETHTVSEDDSGRGYHGPSSSPPPSPSSPFEALYTGKAISPSNFHPPSSLLGPRGGPDVTSHLLSFLTPSDIRSVALCSTDCRSMSMEDALWRTKFAERWNVADGLVGLGWDMTMQVEAKATLETLAPVMTTTSATATASATATTMTSAKTKTKNERNKQTDGTNHFQNDRHLDIGSVGAWRRAYVSAHLNVHDLWVTHWNCVHPGDGNSPGRCCVPDARVVLDGNFEDDGDGGNDDDDDDDDDNDDDDDDDNDNDSNDGISRYGYAKTKASAGACAGASKFDRVRGGSNGAYGGEGLFFPETMRMCPTCRHHPFRLASARWLWLRRRRRRRRRRQHQEEGDEVAGEDKNHKEEEEEDDGDNDDDDDDDDEKRESGHEGGDDLPEMEEALRRELSYCTATRQEEYRQTGNVARSNSSSSRNGDDQAGYKTECEDPIFCAERIARAHGRLLRRDYAPSRSADGRRRCYRQQVRRRAGVPRREEGSAAAAAEAAASIPANNVDHKLYTRSLEYDVSTTPARAIHASALLTAAKWARNIRIAKGVLNSGKTKRCGGGGGGGGSSVSVDNVGSHHGEPRNRRRCTRLCRRRRRRPFDSGRAMNGLERAACGRRELSESAFRRAATFRRRIDPDQYRSSGLAFLTDALFFNVRPTWEKALTGGCKGCDGYDVHDLSFLNGEQCGWTWDDELDGALRDVYSDEAVGARRSRTSAVDAAAGDAASSTGGSGSVAVEGLGDIPASEPPPLNPSLPSSLVRVGGPSHETALHTWHVVRLTNPDFVRPLTYRMYVQRPDCFVAYPAEGFLRPGETTYLTLGVRTLGSVICEAFEEVDVRRERADRLLSEVNEIEAHLPYAPFAIRYMYAPAVPCIPPGFVSRVGGPADEGDENDDDAGSLRDGGRVHGRGRGRGRLSPDDVQGEAAGAQSSDGAAGRGGAGDAWDVLEYLWDGVASEADVRTIFLSAHVHANYSFDDFQGLTLTPFELRPSSSWSGAAAAASTCLPLTFIAPNLQRRDPLLAERLNNLTLELSSSGMGGLYRTEKCCASCGGDWGARAEELSRAHLLKRLSLEGGDRRRSLSMQRFVRCVAGLDHAVSALDSIPELKCRDKGKVRLHCLCHRMRGIAQRLRADRALTMVQKALLGFYETLLDGLCVKMQEGMPKRIDSTDNSSDNQDTQHKFLHSVLDCEHRSDAGVYRSARCTDSVITYVGMETPQNSRVARMLEAIHHYTERASKDEPKHLTSFKMLFQSPGILCLGEQDDPNHIELREAQGSREHFSKQYKASDGIHVQAEGSLFRNRNGLCDWNHADVYRGDAKLAFVSALAMLADPRSLLVNGVYDRLRPPGGVVRRPSLHESLFVCCLDSGFSCKRKTSVEIAVEMTLRGWSEYRQSQMNGHSSQSVKNAALYQPLSLRYAGILSIGHRAILGWKTAGFDWDDPDFDSLALILKNRTSSGIAHRCLGGSIVYQHSMTQFLRGVPPPGVGRYSLSSAARSGGEREIFFLAPNIVRLQIQTEASLSRRPGSNFSSWRETRGIGLLEASVVSDQEAQQRLNDTEQNAIHVDGALDDFEGRGGPHAINLLWLISARFGWYVDDDRHPGAVLVNRGILIATQWLANTLMAAPLFFVLVARFGLWVSADPVDYHLDGLPYSLHKRMRYLTPVECGYASLTIILLWLVLGRYGERNIRRSFERAIMEQVATGNKSSRWILVRISSWISKKSQQFWDSVCPLFLQRVIFTPRWNRRSHSEILRFITQSRSQDFREHRFTFHADAGWGSGVLSSCGTRSVRTRSSRTPPGTIILGFIVALWSFSVSSPHFVLNILTVFCCSMALGLSMSLQYMEIGRGTQALGSRSSFRPMRINVVVVASVLIGQLVGSSGGVLFLAEFIVTSTSLILGGAATISTNAVESWACFFFLSSTAFCGYLFARVGLVDGMRHKRVGWPSFFLSKSLLGSLGSFTFFLLFWNWQVLRTEMIKSSGQRRASFGRNKLEELQ